MWEAWNEVFRSTFELAERSLASEEVNRMKLELRQTMFDQKFRDERKRAGTLRQSFGDNGTSFIQ